MRLRIFVVIEDKSIRDELSRHLSDTGHVVFASPEPVLCDAYHGRFCSADKPCGDVIIVDTHLKRMSGLQYIEDLGNWGCRGQCVKKALIADNLSEAEGRMVEKNSCYVLKKNLDFVEIDAWIADVHRAVDPGRKLADLDVFETM